MIKSVTGLKIRKTGHSVSAIEKNNRRKNVRAAGQFILTGGSFADKYL